MIYRLNKDKEQEAEKSRGSNNDLAEVINPQNIKEAKENIAKSIYHATNKQTTFIPPSHEMHKVPLQYDPTLVRQNPQGPPLAELVEQHREINNEEKTNEIRRGRSESLPNSYNVSDPNYQLSQTTAYQRRAERQV